ncbi:hypothetical protein NVP1131O_43 [Vibrio phage 1.131.O._10N.222.49.A8]|nr:hypothetical protein NVP1131O_43 [Vibrio phage 1.131.O._10N.222.49.A8]
MRPINKTAAMVVSGGAHWEANVKGNNGHYDSKNPIPIQKSPDNTNFIDYTGVRVGRLIVIGLAHNSIAQKKQSTGQAWVCRCDCGNYTIRRSRPIKRGIKMCCGECEALLYIKTAEIERNTGVRPENKDVM